MLNTSGSVGSTAGFSVTRNGANANDELQIYLGSGVYGLRYGANARGTGLGGLFVHEGALFEGGATFSGGGGIAATNGTNIVLSNSGGTPGYVQADHFVPTSTTAMMTGIASALRNQFALVDASGNLVTAPVTSAVIADAALRPSALANATVTIGKGIYPYYDSTSGIVTYVNQLIDTTLSLQSYLPGGSAQERYVAIYAGVVGGTPGFYVAAASAAATGGGLFPTNVPTGATLLGIVKLTSAMGTTSSSSYVFLWSDFFYPRSGLATTPVALSAVTGAPTGNSYVTASGTGNTGLTAAHSLRDVLTNVQTVGDTIFDPANRTSAALWVPPGYFRTAFDSASLTDLLTGAVGANILTAGTLVAGAGGNAGKLGIDPTASGPIGLFANGKMMKLATVAYSQSFTGAAAGAYTLYAETNTGSNGVWSPICNVKGATPSATQLPLCHVWWDGTQFQVGGNAFIDWTPAFPGYAGSLKYAQAFADTIQTAKAPTGGYREMTTGAGPSDAPIQTLYTPTALRGIVHAKYELITGASLPPPFLVSMKLNGGPPVHRNYVTQAVSSTSTHHDSFLFDGSDAATVPLLGIGATTLQMATWYTTTAPQYQYVRVDGRFELP
jgi:hypothetical protein